MTTPTQTLYRSYIIEEYFLTEEPFYVPVGDEIELFEAAYREKIPVLFKGPTGVGKTRFVEYMSYRLGTSLTKVSQRSEQDGAPDASANGANVPAGHHRLPRGPDGQRPGRPASCWRARARSGSTGR